MFCILNFIFILIISIQFNNNIITLFQFILYAILGLAMFYYNSKQYWSYEEKHTHTKQNKKRTINQNRHKRY